MSKLEILKQTYAEAKPAHQVKKMFIAGLGAVGGTLLKQASKLSRQSLRDQSLRVLGVCNTNHVLWYDHTQSEYSLKQLRQAPGKDWNLIIKKLSSYEPGSVVFIDATGSGELIHLYPELLNSGIHVVTPSKLANTQSYAVFESLRQTALENGVKFLYETNVGAGLPIIQSLKNLIETGDEIVELNGVLSGTMTYLFSELDKGETFSKTVIRARTLGYAEPDPREDLSGEDVARKFLILARVCGLSAEREDLEVESLIPEPLKNVDAGTFFDKLPAFDEEWKERLATEHRKGNTLRFTGSLENESITVGIQSVPRLSPLGQLTGTNNLIQIKTRRYFDQPLIIQGPGAGKEVTAAGILADVLSV